MPLRLDNAKGVAHMPTAGAAKNKSFEPRFKIDHAASPMPETRQPERSPGFCSVHFSKKAGSTAATREFFPPQVSV
jgi:hypothetical protein